MEFIIDLTSLTTAIIRLIIKFTKYPLFNQLFLDYEKQQSNNIYTELNNILFNESIHSWELYYNLLNLEKNINNNNNKKESNSKIIPDKFLDPLLNSIITNPVILPDSKQFIDKSTILKHLENNETDPFTRTKLTINELNEYNSSDEIINKLNDFISERDACL